MGENGSLTPKQYKFLSLLLAPMTITDAAKDAHIGEATAYRWLNDPSFKQILDTSQADLFDQGMAALKGKFTKAVLTLDRNMDAEQAADQIRSARTVIEQVIANQKLTERIAELEALLVQREQERLYHVSFDLRELTTSQREALEAIESARAGREDTIA